MRPTLKSYCDGKIIRKNIPDTRVTDMLDAHGEPCYVRMSLIQIICMDILDYQAVIDTAHLPKDIAINSDLFDKMVQIIGNNEVYNLDIPIPRAILTEYDAERIIEDELCEFSEEDTRMLYEKARRVSIYSTPETYRVDQMISQCYQFLHVEKVEYLPYYHNGDRSFMITYRHPKFFMIMLLTRLLNQILFDYESAYAKKHPEYTKDDADDYSTCTEDDPKIIQSFRSVLAAIVEDSNVFCDEMLENYHPDYNYISCDD